MSNHTERSDRIEALDDRSLITIDVQENQITATDLAGHRFEIDARGWVETDPADAPEFSVRTDRRLTGRATELRFDPGHCSFTILDGPDPDRILTQAAETDVQQIGDQYHPMPGTTLDLPEGSYRIRSEGSLAGFIRVDGEFTLSWEPDTERVVLTFPHPTTMALGFRSGIDLPRGTITVPPTPDGIATALSHLSAGLRTTDPERSFPTMRSHPPAIEFGADAHVPTEVREHTPETGIEFVVPPRNDALLPIAPLAYYLGATVRTGDTPALRVPDRDYEYPLPDPPDLQYRAARLLRRVFYLDCLVRNAGAWGSDLRELDVLDRDGVDLDVQACYQQSSAERLLTYMEQDFERIAGAFPAWRHWMYADPDDPDEVVRSLPTMLSDLSLVFTPAARDSADRVDAIGDTEASRWESVVGALGANAEAGPNEYPASLAGYRNRLAHATRADERTNVTVFALGPEAETRSEWIEAHYRQQLGADGTVERRVVRDTAHLTELLARPTDLLHLVGECTSDGIVCPDGVLDPVDLPENNVRLFVLDHPDDADHGSAVDVGRGLVDTGSVSGLVLADRSTPSTSPPAALEPGTYPDHLTSTPAFATSGLLLSGASTQMARQTARYLCSDATVTAVGDGAYRMFSRGVPVFLLELAADHGEFEIDIHQLFVSPGGVVAGIEEQPMLSGAHERSVLDARTVSRELLGQDKIIYDGELYWPAESKRLFYPLA